MSTTRQTPLDIHHPAFRDGYQKGRYHYFQEPSIFTDKNLVECLQSVFESGEQEEKEKPGEDLYYSIGYLVGQMSGCVLPCQPHEDPTRDLQEPFLIKVMQTYGDAGPTMAKIIRQFWAMQDQLARSLDADTFEQMLNRGVEQNY